MLKSHNLDCDKVQRFTSWIALQLSLLRGEKYKLNWNPTMTKSIKIAGPRVTNISSDINIPTYLQISFQILSCQREKLEKFKCLLHKTQHANNGKNNTQLPGKKGWKEVKFYESNKTPWETTTRTDLTSSLLHAVFDRFTQSTLKCMILVPNI